MLVRAGSICSGLGDALSAVSVRKYDLALVLVRYQEADRLAAGGSDGRLRAMARWKVAQAYFNTDRHPEAVAAGRQASELARAVGAFDVAGNAPRTLGAGLLTLARFEEAEVALREAAELAVQHGTADELARP